MGLDGEDGGYIHSGWWLNDLMSLRMVKRKKVLWWGLMLSNEVMGVTDDWGWLMMVLTSCLWLVYGS